MVEIYIVRDKAGMDLVHEIRREVFIDEQGVPEELEMDELDQAAIHALAYVDSVPAACGRILLNGDSAKIGRVAVRKNVRRSGIGAGVCKLLISIAEDRDIQSIFVNAQLSAVNFYKSLGFTKEGNTFMEAGIEHVKMVKTL